MNYTLVSNGRRIACAVSGRPKNAVPLVLLHGFCEDSSVWEPLLPAFADMPLIRIDLPGFGKSDLPLSPGMDTAADAVCTVLNELGIEQCVLAGHSMGGYVALPFAQKYGERLAGLGLVHSHPYEDSAARKENRQRGIDMIGSGKKDLYVAQLFPGLFAPAFVEKHPETVQALIRQGQLQQAEGIIAALQGMIARPNHLDTLRRIACPVLFILGELDAIIPPEWALAAAHLPQLSDIHLLDGVGHMGMFEAGAQTAEALQRFRQFCGGR